MEDNPVDVKMVEGLIPAGGLHPFSLSSVRTLAEAEEAVESADVVLLDLSLPDSEGLGTLDSLLACGAGSPVVVLTASEDDSLGFEAVAKGAEDVLVKGTADARSLMRSLNYAMERHRARRELAKVSDELRDANSRLEEMVVLDPLTEVANRRGLDARLEEELARAERDGVPLVALLVDLDEFKEINDGHGHSVGDVVLREVAMAITTCVRPTDFAARVGGDEFVVLLGSARRAEAERVAERVRAAIASAGMVVDGERLSVTASIGLAEVGSGVAGTESLLAALHAPLKASKGGGKDMVSSTLGGASPKANGEAASLEAALEDGVGIHAVRQPIRRLLGEAVVAWEILVRSSVPGCESPADLFRAGRESDLLERLDLECLRSCLSAAADVDDRHMVHVNVLPATLAGVPPEKILALIPEGRPGERLRLEVSEQQIVGDPAYLSEPLAALAEDGVRLCLDDVGFGRSNLESLVVLEPNVVKLSKTAVQGVGRAPGKLRVAQRLTQVAKAVGAKVVAVGIEDRRDLEALMNVGVEFGQGYLLGRPE